MSHFISVCLKKSIVKLLPEKKNPTYLLPNLVFYCNSLLCVAFLLNTIWAAWMDNKLYGNEAIHSLSNDVFATLWNVTVTFCKREQRSCERRRNVKWNIQDFFVWTMHEARLIHIWLWRVPLGFLSVRLSTHEVLQWSESFDRLLSHKCKWTISIFQGEQSLLPCPVQSASTKWAPPQFSSVMAVSRVFYFLLIPKPTQFLSSLSFSYITLYYFFLCREDPVMQSLQPNESHDLPIKHLNLTSK